MVAQDDATALSQLHTDFVEAFRSNDPEKISAFFSEGAVLLPPRRALVSGKADVVSFWQNAQRMQNLSFESTDVEPLGDTILREAGNLTITMRGEGRETRTMDAKYMAVWVKSGENWKLDSLVWNGSSGPQSGRGGQRAGGGYGQQRGAAGGGNAGGGYGQRPGGRGRQGGGGRGGRGGQGGGGQGGGGGQAGGYGQGAGHGGGGARRGRGGAGGGQAGGYAGQGGGSGNQGGAYGQRGGGGGGAGGQAGGYGQGGGGGQGGYGGGRAGGGRGGRAGGGGGGGGGGFGRRGHQRDHDDAPVIPRVDD